MSEESVYAAIAFCGTMILALSRILVMKRQRATDLSYMSMALFVVAIVGFLVYYGYYGLWAAFIPSTLSLAIMLWLVWLKVYYDEFSPKRTAEAAGVGEDTGGDAGQTRKGEKSTRAELVGGVKDAVPSSKLQPLMSSW